MYRTGDDGERDLDVVIVGGGIAGLAAAWRLRHRRLAVLEALPRPGGRIHTVMTDTAPLNLGAHMVPGAGSVIGALVDEIGLATRPLPPSLFAIAYAGRRHLTTPQALLPFVMNLSFRERVAFARLGALLRLGAGRAVAIAQPRSGETTAETQARILAFEDNRTLAELVGPLPGRVAELFRALTERNGADPDQMSAGHGLRSFANVWQKSAPGLNIVGGTAALPRALAHRLGVAFRPGCRVTRVTLQGKRGVDVRFRSDSGQASVTARACILAVPSAISAAIAPDLPERTRYALSKIRYGAFMSMAVRLDGPLQLPWQATYAIATPGLGFSVLFNHDAMRPAVEDGHSMMLFRGAGGAQAQIEAGEDAMVAKWLADLETHFPETRGRIRDIVPIAWPIGAPFAFPGRAHLQPDLMACAPPLLLAGDYLDFPNMESAATAGDRAARRLDQWLGNAPGPAAASAQSML
ncbi:MAG: flavin monoamine oxidase family protein [Inquilinaceae bacterium]